MNYFFTRVISRLGFLKKLNLSVKRNINGKQVVIPVINGCGQDNLLISELWMCSLMEKILPLKKGAFMDIGVNVGQTLIKLRTVDDSIDYIGFEPNPLCVYYAAELIKANRYANTRLVPTGIFNDNGVLQLNMYSSGDTDSAASLINNFRPGEKVFHKIFVPVTRFETISPLLSINEIAVVKIDVEGAELEVLQSLENTLQTTRPFIFIEILPCYNKDNSERINRQLKIEQLLTNLKYHIFRVIKDNNSVKELLSLNAIGIHADLTMCEYVMSPAESAAAVASLFNKP